MPPGPSARTDVCAVFTAFHPDPSFPARVAGIAHQVAAVVVVDNGSRADAAAMLDRLASAPAVHVIRNGANLGLAAALNRGIQWADRQGYRWTILLDQDSNPLPSMARVLLETYLAAEERQGRIGIVGARFARSMAVAQGWDSALPGPTWTETEVVITSGMLLPTAVFAELGPLREEFFVDMVDVDYCLRARAHGYRVIVTDTPVMEHSVGHRRAHQLFGRTYWPSNHAAWRRYYIMRNTVRLLRDYGRSERKWAVDAVYGTGQWVAQIALFEDQKIRKLKNVALGLVDGMGSMRDRGIR